MKVNIDGGFLVSEKVGNGVPLLFIHGYPLSRKIWLPQVERLSEQATVITLDLRGHGESFPFDGAYPMDLLAIDCSRVLSALQVEPPVVICGLSMGGYVTMALYRKYPKLFRGMILTSTRSRSDSIESKNNRNVSIKNVHEHGPLFIADNMLPKMFSPKTLTIKPELVKMIHEIMANTSAQGIAGALQGMRDRPDSTPMLSQIQCPVMIAHGVDDQLIPFNEAEEMHQQIANSQLVKIPDAGHLLNLEQPEIYNQAVRDFLLSLS